MAMVGQILRPLVPKPRNTKFTVIDSLKSLVDVIEAVKGLPRNENRLYVDLEGVKLSRFGSVSFVNIYAPQWRRAYLVDVHVLGSKTFQQPGPDGTTLKSIFESDLITKVFFDVRNDSDALCHLHDVRLPLNGIEDIQLMRLALQPPSMRRFLPGLELCITKDAQLFPEVLKAWQKAKIKGLELFSPRQGGSYAVFNERPVKDAIIRYSVNDLLHLPHLRQLYMSQLDDEWKRRVLKETNRRVQESQKEVPVKPDSQMSRGPEAWRTRYRAASKTGHAKKEPKSPGNPGVKIPTS